MNWFMGSTLSTVTLGVSIMYINSFPCFKASSPTLIYVKLMNHSCMSVKGFRCYTTSILSEKIVPYHISSTKLNAFPLFSSQTFRFFCVTYYHKRKFSSPQSAIKFQRRKKSDKSKVSEQIKDFPFTFDFSIGEKLVSISITKGR
jgi:hypothetical protein